MNSMFGLLINLIIIFVIFVAIMKRVQEVTKKAQELKTQPPVTPPIFPKAILEPTEERPSPQWQPSQELKPSVEQEKPVVFREDLWEHLKEELPEPEVEETFQPPVEFVQKVPYQEVLKSVREHEPRLYFSFSGSELVKGIIMSEILGQPLSLRSY